MTTLVSDTPVTSLLGALIPLDQWLHVIQVDAKNWYTARMFNFAHTDYSTYYKGKSLSQY